MNIAFILFSGDPQNHKRTIHRIRRALKNSRSADFYSVGFNDGIRDASENFPSDHINFTSKDAKDLRYSFKGHSKTGKFSLIPGNADIPVILLFKRLPEYDYYFVCEDDVAFTGSLPALIGDLSHDDSDLLCTHLHEAPPNWDYRSTFRVPKGIETPTSARLCFLPFFRVSRRALETIHESYVNGWAGHHEISWPQILENAGMKVTDIGGDNMFVSDTYRNKYYTGRVDQSGRKHGSFKPTPPRLLPGRAKNRLYHPVKPLKYYLIGWKKRSLSIMKYYMSKWGHRK